jgi:hypothetical protein
VKQFLRAEIRQSGCAQATLLLLGVHTVRLNGAGAQRLAEAGALVIGWFQTGVSSASAFGAEAGWSGLSSALERTSTDIHR